MLCCEVVGCVYGCGVFGVAWMGVVSYNGGCLCGQPTSRQAGQGRQPGHDLPLHATNLYLFVPLASAQHLPAARCRDKFAEF